METFPETISFLENVIFMAFNQSALRNYFQRQKQPISGRGKTTAFVNDLDSFITFNHGSVVHDHESG